MQDLLQNPMIQAGVAPLAVALGLGAVLWRTPLAWFAVTVAYATAVALSTGIGFTPFCCTVVCAATSAGCCQKARRDHQ